VHRKAWQLFKPHHYLSGELHRAAQCFVAFVELESRLQAACDRRPADFGELSRAEAGTPTLAAFTAVLHAPDSRGGYWREHRTVCLPDFQGVGIGNALSEFVASLFVATGKRYCSRTSHPAMIRHRARSPLWTMPRGTYFARRNTNEFASLNRSAAIFRLTASFRFVGAPDYENARAFGVM
jgi:hypothetical protein